MPSEVDEGALSPLPAQTSVSPLVEFKNPGTTAYRYLPGDQDLTTYLKSSGIANCAVLTVFHPRTRSRAMFHFNKFANSCDQPVKDLLATVAASHPVTELVVSVAENAYAVGKGASCKAQLVQVIGQALPTLSEVHVYRFQHPQQGATGAKKVSIYLTPTGELFGTGD
jgi:hypothetical protein